MADHQAQAATKHVKEEALDVFEFVEVPQDVHQLCTACLCATRTTRTLSDDALKQYYMHILTEMQIFDASVLSMRFCWECVSVMKKAVHFRERAKESYNILHSAELMSNKEDLNDLLLKYSSNPGRFNICHSHHIDIRPTGQQHPAPIVLNQAPEKMVTIINDRPTGQQNPAPIVLNQPPAETVTITNDRPTGQQQPAPVVLNQAPEKMVTIIFDRPTGQRKTAQVVLNQAPAEMVTIKKEMPTMPENDIESDEDVDGVEDTDDENDELVMLVEAKPGASSDAGGSKPVQKEAEQQTGSAMNVVHQNVKKSLLSACACKCLVCLKTFTRGKAFFGHMRLHTGEKPYSCGVCQKAFARQQNLITHMKSHSGVESFKMKVMRTDTGETSLQRDVCSMSNVQLMKHKSTPGEKKVIKCEICSKVFKVNRSLKQHIMRIHTGEKPFQCEVCSKTFATAVGLGQHMIRHTKLKPYKCEHCQRPFARKSECINHMRRLHTFRGNLECNACKQTFTQKAEWQEHMKTHKGQKAYQCQLCPKAYNKYFYLKDHEKSHTGEKPFLCDFCPQGFTTKSLLKQHRRIHTGEKPYQCEVCLISFKQNSSLYQHRRIAHISEKPFKCDECGRAFSLKAQLKTHLKKHTRT